MTGTSVTIYGVELNWVLEFNKVNRSIVSIPKWINDSIDIDTNVYVRKLTGLEYVFRATDSEKYFWEILMLSHQKYELIDCVHCLLGDIWILSIESEWTGNENDSNPWTLTMEVLGSGIFTTPLCCIVGCPNPENIILNPNFLNELDDWVHDNNVTINGDGELEVLPQTGNVIENYSFLDGWDNWTHTDEAILRDDDGYDDLYSVQLNSSGAKITQIISGLPTDDNSWAVTSFTFLAKGTGVLKLTNYYTDGTSETENRSIFVTENCEWGTSYPCIPYCMPYGMINGRVISSFSLEWVSGDVQVDYIRLYYNINYGTIRQELTTPISVECIEEYMLENVFKGYYLDDPCGGETWAGSATVILECTDDTSVTIPHAYNSYGTWEEDDWILSDYISGKSLKAITIIFYPENHTINCKKIKMVPLDDPLGN